MANVYDLENELFKSRIIFVTGEVNTHMANSVIKQLLIMNEEDSSAEIRMIINSPGGAIVDGLAIHDVMRRIEAPVHTICCGYAASMGAVLLAAGNIRSIYENSEVMIHQPLGGIQGKSEDIIIAAERIKRLRHKLEELLSKYTKQPLDKIHQDCDIDHWMTAQEALEYGIVDNILEID